MILYMVCIKEILFVTFISEKIIMNRTKLQILFNYFIFSF